MRAKATDAISDPIGIDSTLRETMDEIDMSISAPDEPYMTYDPDPPVPIESPKKPRSPRKAAAETAAAPAPAKKTTAATSGKTAAAKTSKPASTPRKRPAPKVVS